MDLDPIRLRVLERIERTGTDLKKASLACGKNAAYVHQFIYRGTPKILPEDVRESLAKHLGVNDRELRHPEVPPRKPASRGRKSTTSKRMATPASVRGGQRWASRPLPRSTCAPQPGRERSTRGSRRLRKHGFSPTT